MHEDNNKTKSRAVIALGLCFCVLVLASAFTVRSSLDKISGSGTTVTDNETPVNESRETASETPVVDSKDSSKTATEGSHSTPDYISPLEGPILLKYSMGSLVYSKTLDQYMTHPGIDIAADISTEVKAIADGTVTKVYNDDRYGVTVCITHSDGLMSKYSNLSEHGLIETGDEVKQGQIIGNVGDTALFESLDEAHLHFEMIMDDNCADPGDYIDEFKCE